MKLTNVLANVVSVVTGIDVKGKRDPRLGALDRGILDVAMMVSALDGDMLPAEIDAFHTLAKKCRGYSAKGAKASFDAAVCKAGRLMAMSKIADYTEKDRLAAFVDEAVKALPDGFADGNLEDVRRAFAMWLSMGIADGDFSSIERKAIQALKQRFTDIRVANVEDEIERWRALSPTFHMAYGTKVRPTTVKILEDDFLERAEALIVAMASAAKKEKAERDLAELIGVVKAKASKGEPAVTRRTNTIGLKFAMAVTGSPKEALRRIQTP